MPRFKTMVSARNSAHAYRTWTAGQLVEKGTYACRRCNTEMTLGQRGYLPLCPSCYSRRFSLI